MIEENKAIPYILLEINDSNIPVQKSVLLSKLDPDDMLKMLDNNQGDKTIKKYYKKEAEKASATIKFLNKKISENPIMSSKKIDIITQLKELYGLRELFFMNKFNSKPEKNISIDINLEIKKVVVCLLIKINL